MSKKKLNMINGQYRLFVTQSEAKSPIDMEGEVTGRKGILRESGMLRVAQHDKLTFTYVTSWDEL